MLRRLVFVCLICVSVPLVVLGMSLTGNVLSGITIFLSTVVEALTVRNPSSSTVVTDVTEIVAPVVSDAGGGEATISTGIASGIEYPLTPAVGDMIWLTQDSASGAGNSSAGTAQSFCRWDGTAWQCLGTDFLRNSKADCSSDIALGLWCRNSTTGAITLGDGSSAVNIVPSITLKDVRVAGNIDDTATSAASAPTWGGSTTRCRIYQDLTLGPIIECFQVADGVVLTFDEIIYNGDPKRWILHNGGSRDVCMSMDDAGLLTFASGTESCGSVAGSTNWSGIMTNTGGVKKSVRVGTADTYPMVDADCGSTIGNADADPLTVNLISSPSACRVCFFAETAQTITATPAAGDSIIVAGLTPAAGASVTLAAAVGNNFCLQGKDGATWWGILNTGTLSTP